MAITLPYTFDTTSVFHTILKGAAGLTAGLAACVLLALISGKFAAAAGLTLADLFLLFVTTRLFRLPIGSLGTLTAGQVVIEPNKVMWLSLPGPVGAYTLDSFSAIRVEFFMGPVSASPNAGRPNEIVWLVGKPGTPNVAIANTEDGAGRVVGQEFGALLKLPIEELNAPKVITVGM